MLRESSEIRRKDMSLFVPLTLRMAAMVGLLEAWMVWKTEAKKDTVLHSRDIFFSIFDTACNGFLVGAVACATICVILMEAKPGVLANYLNWSERAQFKFLIMSFFVAIFWQAKKFPIESLLRAANLPESDVNVMRFFFEIVLNLAAAFLLVNYAKSSTYRWTHRPTFFLPNDEEPSDLVVTSNLAAQPWRAA